MFEIVRVGPAPGQPRLEAQAGLVSADFEKIAAALGATPFSARKSGFVAAREAAQRSRIETLWNGKETEVVAEPGDFVVTNLSPDRAVLKDGSGHANSYVIKGPRFAKLYKRDRGESEFGKIYRSRTTVDALFVAGGFDILAPWGEAQRADSGYILRNGDEIYGNHKDTFEATYERA